MNHLLGLATSHFGAYGVLYSTIDGGEGKNAASLLSDACLAGVCPIHYPIVHTTQLPDTGPKTHVLW